MKIKNLKGFTLVEILIVMAILISIMVISSEYIVSGLKLSKFESEQETAVQIARDAMKIVTKEIRKASQSELGDYTLSSTTSQDFTYFSDINDDGKTEKIRYFLDNTKLVKAVTESGADNLYSGIVATSTVAEYMNNQTEAVFKYYSADYVETSEINKIKMININLKINVTPTIMPNDYYIETDVNLRNLKDNL
ncbi:type II secretion system protein [Candidatus Parcubacteria bacterium]|nr:type II secretion system protein [Candidatus Parcubacteria bacterium]